MDTLPEELLLTILHHLDSPAPSRLNSRKEPTQDLTRSATTPIYKTVSRVSKRWRRIVTPLLFRHARLHLDISPRPEWAACPVCGPAPRAADDDNDDSIDRDDHVQLNDAIAHDRTASTPDARERIRAWVNQLYHSSTDFLSFLRTRDLQSTVESVVVVTGGTLPHADLLAGGSGQDSAFGAAAALWKHMFALIDPSTVTVLAPPADLACLTNCAIDMSGDRAFEDMGYQILELTGTNTAARRQEDMGSGRSDWVGLDRREYVPTGEPGIAASSILRLKPWTQMSLNEGSFLKAYGTYEYFERGPPSIVSSIIQCVASKSATDPSGSPQHGGGDDGGNIHHLQKFTYTAIFPFANHVDFRHLVPHIEELDVKLAPDPGSEILNDKARTGRADLQDCWSELLMGYEFITAPLRRREIGSAGTPKLQKFICRDVVIPALVEELDDVFIGLCMPVWAEMEPGLFVRQSNGFTYAFGDE